MQLFDQLKSPILCLAFSPDGATLVATPGHRRTLGCWTFPEGEFSQLHPSVNGRLSCHAYSPEGTILAVGSMDGVVRLYIFGEKNDDLEFYPGDPHGQQIPVYQMAFAPHRLKNPVLATASLGMKLYSVSGRILADDGFFTALAWSPDGKALAGINDMDMQGSVVIVWILDRTLRPQLRHEIQLPRASSLAFSPDGRILAVADENAVRSYNVHRTSLSPGPVFYGHRGTVNQLAFHPNEQWLATASDDQTVRFWDAASGKERESFNWEIGRVRALAFAPDGMRCAAGGDKGRVVIWDVDV